MTPAIMASRWNDRLIRGVFLLTLTVFAAIAVSAYIGMKSYLANTRSVAISRTRHLEMDELVSSLKDVQRGARGFVITRDTSFLSPYREGIDRIQREFDALDRSVVSDAQERRELATIRAQSDRLIAMADREILFTRRGEADSARETVRGGEAKRSMDAVVAIAAAIEQRESGRLAGRLGDAETDFHKSVLVLVLGTVMNFVLIITMFMLMNLQIRERRETAETLKLGEQRLQTVVNSLQEGITFSNASGGFEVFNTRMAEITGYTVEEANRSGDFAELLYSDPAAHQKALDGIRRVIEEPGVHTAETSIRSRKGESRLLRVSSQMLIHAGKRMFLTTYSDITEQKRMEIALRESEEKLRLIFEHALDGISIFEETPDPSDRRLVECNPRYAELAGRSREELLSLGSTRGLAESLSEDSAEAIEGSVAFRGIFSWIRPDAHENIIEYTAVPITMRGKKYTIGIDRDVTDARRAERLVRESQQRYRHLFESSPIPLIVYHTGSLRILEVNPATVEHYGYSREELLKMTVTELKPPEDVSAFLDYLEERAGDAERAGTCRHRRKDGSVIQVEIKSDAIDWRGESARLVLVHDVTESLRFAEELRVQKAHFERLFESAPEGIAVLDGSGNVLEVNRAFVHMFGYRREEILGHNLIAGIVPEEGQEEARTALDAVMEGVSVHLEAQRVRKDGRRVDISLIAVPVEDGRGSHVAYILYRDISQRKRGEQEREDLIRQLRKALADVKTLGGLLPICAWCKKIRDDQGYYHQIETFIARHSDAKFTHGICPECREKFDREAGAANPSCTQRTG